MATGIKANNTYTVFVIRDDEGKPAFTSDMMEELLGAHAAPDITGANSAYVGFSHGVCDIRNGGQCTGEELDSQYEHLLIFAYRFDRRSPSPDAVQKEVDAIVEARKQENNGSYELTKAVYKEILQEAKTRVMPRTPVRSKVATVMYDTSTGVLLIGGASEKEEDIINGLIQRWTQIVAVPVNPVEATAALNAECVAGMAVLEPQIREIPAGMHSIVSDLALWLWHATDMNVGGNTDAATFKPIIGKQLSTCSLNGDTLVVGDITVEGKTSEPIASKESDHAHIRYALWKDAKSVTSATFQLVTDIGTTGLSSSVGLNSQTPDTIRIGFSAKDEVKVLTKRYVPPKRFQGVGASNDEERIHEYNVLMGRHADEQASALSLYVGYAFTTLYAFLGMSSLFLQARAVPVRWSQTKGIINEWLMGYVPECERNEFLKEHVASKKEPADTQQ